MQIISHITQMQQVVLKLRETGKKQLVLFPQWGIYMRGHATLLQQAREENDIVVLSVFVNPLQFGPNEDFDRYPRNIERDECVAKEAGADYLFLSECYRDVSIETDNNDYGDIPH
ncbi:hypothetical protein GCM10020331_067280 [Ectobacillus funiculus]